MPRFHRPAYAVYRTADAGEMLVRVLDSLAAQVAQVMTPAPAAVA
jgi:hypothetical protein